MPQGYIYNWTGKVSSTYLTAGNWFNTTANATATAAPGPNDQALVVASGAINGAGSAYFLALTGTGGGLSVGGSLYGSYTYVGGTITLASGASLYSPNLIDIGDNASSALSGKVPTVLTVGANAYISAQLATANTFDVLVGSNGGSGTLAVNGTNAIASSGTVGFWVGNSGTGVITVTNGGSVQGGTPFGSGVRQIDLALGSGNGTGTLNVSGASSGATFTNTVEVGFGGVGAISVSAGAKFYAGEGVSSLNIGDTYNGMVGSGTVSFDASQATLAGLVEVGAYGQGSMSLTDGASVVAYYPASNTAAPIWSVLVAANAGSSGTLSLAGQSSLILAEGIGVGEGGAGQLNVTSSSLTLLAQPAVGTIGLDAGLSPGSNGVVNVSGGLISDVHLAGTVIGQSGNGTLAITAQGSQAGTVLTGNTTSGVGLTVGATGGSNGVVTVSGAASQLGVYGEVADGAGGNGAITLSAGGQLIAGYDDGSTGLVLGGSGGTGSLTVTSGAVVSVLGQIAVGQSGTGVLVDAAGGTLVSSATGIPALVVGAATNVVGHVLISDPSTTATLAGGIIVGSSGAGTLVVQNQTSVLTYDTGSDTVPALLVAAGAGSSGTVSITSQAQFLSSGSGVAIGSAGTGVLNVTNATLTVNVAADTGVSALSLGVAAGAAGTANILGGLVVDNQAAGVVVGEAGSGTLAIGQSGGQGGILLTGDPTGTAGLAVGVQQGASGSVSISGTSSGASVYGAVTDGVSGHGSIGLSNGGHLGVVLSPGAADLVIGGYGGTGVFTLASGASASISGQTQVGQAGVGVLSVTGGSSLSGSASGVPALVIGASSLGTGSVVASDAGSYVKLTGGLIVGNSGVGSLSVANAAILQEIGSTAAGLPGVIVANNAGSSGTMSVSAGGAVLANTGFAIGAFGHGALNITSANVTITTAPGGAPALDAGVNVGGSGSVAVSGGTLSDTQAAGMVIGDVGSGTLTVSQLGSVGGIVLTGHPNTSSGLLVGNAASATGSVSVSGTASGVNVYGTVVLGANGVGAMSVVGGVINGGYATNGAGFVLGKYAAGIGSLSLSGGARASVLGQAVVGQLGSGFLSITGGSSLTGQESAGTAGLVVGAVVGGTGNVVISDAGTAVTLAGGIDVGVAGLGTLSVQTGAHLQDAATVTVGSHGTVSVAGSGAALTAGVLVDSGSLGVSGGATLSFLGGGSGSGAIAVGGASLLSFGGTETNGIAFGSGGGTVSVLAAANLKGVVSGFAAGDFIDLKNTVATTESFANGTLSLFSASNTLVGTIAFSGALASHNFSLTALSGGGTAIGYHS